MERYQNKRRIVVFADDDEDDRLLVKEAFESTEIPSDLYFAVCGQDLIEYLRHQGKYSDGSIPSPRPDLILLDLNMPNKNGHEALQEIKDDPELSDIPVIILTTSNQREDITRCYDLGANSFICKPNTYGELQRIADSFCFYWMRIASLPQQAIA